MDRPDQGEELEFEALVHQMSEGSMEAAEKLVDRYSGNILRAVRRSLPKVIRPKLDSVDIFQSIWLSLLSKQAGLATLKTPQQFVAYVTSTARLKVLEKYRHFTKTQAFDIRRERRLDGIESNYRADPNKPTPRLEAHDTKSPSASTIAETRETWRNLLSNCTERDRQAIKLRLAGMTYEEIGSQLNTCGRTVRRGLQKLFETMPK